MKLKYIHAIINELKKELPGKEAQYKMAPEIRLKLQESSNNIKAAVLILLFPDKNELNTVLIKRNTDSSSHSGQVSLPGGRFETKDIKLEQTALRECEEETGINKNEIKIIGALTSLYIHVSNYIVAPYIGFIDHKPKFIPDPKEVQYIIQTTLKTLIDPEKIKTTSMNYSGTAFYVPYFDLNDEMVWGATAMILNEFIEILKNIK